MENTKTLSDEELLERIIKTLKEIWDDPNRRFEYQKNIEGETIIFVTNSKKYTVVDTENHIEI